MKALETILNKKFGRLFVLNQEPSKDRHRMVRCQCDCGSETVTRVSALLSNNTFSCGCYDREVRLLSLASGHVKRSNGATHNGKVTVEYNSYRHIKSRCYRKSDHKYPNYGARGIIVCDRWLGKNGYKNFLSDMGKRPSHCNSIERVDVNGNYEPSNCIWATKEVQARNKTNTVRISFNGQDYCQAEFARLLKVSDRSVGNHLSKGKTASQIFNHFKYKNVC